MLRRYFRVLLTAGAIRMAAATPHVVLLGDSIFDNQVYVRRGEPDVAAQLQATLRAAVGPDAKVTLCAVDGSTATHVAKQLQRVPPGATHLVVSTGGNDMLHKKYEVENMRLTSGQHALYALSQISDDFERTYRQMLDLASAKGLPVTVVLPYYPLFPPGPQLSGARVGHGVYVDCMLREAFRRGLPVIDLRALFTAPEDYANPIEPSAIGGQKMADLIAEVVAKHNFAAGRTVVYAAPSQPSRPSDPAAGMSASDVYRRLRQEVAKCDPRLDGPGSHADLAWLNNDANMAARIPAGRTESERREEAALRAYIDEIKTLHRDRRQ